MPRRRAAAPVSSEGEQVSSASAAEPHSGASPGADGEPGPPRTFTAPSGKHYVLAGESYPETVPPDFLADVVSASEGDLLEVVLIHEGWVYGRRFKARDNCVNEGVFRLDWVYGVRLTLEKGEKKVVEVDIHSPAYGYRAPAPSSISDKLRIKMFRRKVEDVAKVWNMVQGSSQEAPLADVAGRCRKAEEEAARAAAAALELAVSAEDKREAGGKTESKKKRAKKQRGGARQLERHDEEQEREASSSPPAQDSEGCSDRLLGALAGDRRSRPQRPLVERTWQAQWERQAAHLESLLSASSSGVEDGTSDSSGRSCPSQQKLLTRKVARSLMQAKRTGELQAIAEEWEKAQSEFASKASDISALNAKVKQSLLNAHRTGDLERLAEEMAEEAERKAAEVKALKERVFRALREKTRTTRRAREELEQTASDMDDAQNELEMRALQIKSLMKKAWKGMVETRRTRELERIADEMAEQLRAKAEALKHKIAQGLLRAHRSGELREIRDELEELADSVAVLDDEAGVVDRGGEPSALRTPTSRRRRWAECPSSDSDSSSFDPREAHHQRRPDGRARPGVGDAADAAAAPLEGGENAGGPHRGDARAVAGGGSGGVNALVAPRLVVRPSRAGPLGSPGEADVSCSDAESSAGAPSPS